MNIYPHSVLFHFGYSPNLFRPRANALWRPAGHAPYRLLPVNPETLIFGGIHTNICMRSERTSPFNVLRLCYFFSFDRQVVPVLTQSFFCLVHRLTFFAPLRRGRYKKLPPDIYRTAVYLFYSILQSPANSQYRLSALIIVLCPIIPLSPLIPPCEYS